MAYTTATLIATDPLRRLLIVFLLVLLDPASSWAALTKTFLGSNVTGDATAVTTFQLTVDSTGQTHIVCFVKHEGAPTTITESDNKGSGAFNLLTKVDHLNGDLSSRLMWVKIGTPGASHTVTVTYGAARPYSRLACWGVNSGTGELALDVEATAQGNGATFDAGTLATTAATVSFQGVGEYTSTIYDPGSGWTEDLDNNIFAQSRSDASGTLDPVCTIPSGTMDWVTNAASFKEAAGGGGGGTAKQLMLMGVGQ